MWGGTESVRSGLRVPSPPGVIGYVSDYCWYPVSKTVYPDSAGLQRIPLPLTPSLHLPLRQSLEVPHLQAFC